MSAILTKLSADTTVFQGKNQFRLYPKPLPCFAINTRPYICGIMRSLIFWIKDAPSMIATPETSLPEKPLLLIVDDDPLISDTLSFSMSPVFEVITSHSRQHCTQLLRQLRRAPELALID